MAGGRTVTADRSYHGLTKIIRGSGPGATPRVDVRNVTTGLRLVDSFAVVRNERRIAAARPKRPLQTE